MRNTWLYRLTRVEAEAMIKSNTTRHMQLKPQQGSTLIEVLVTMLVVAIGLLGAAGLQLAATRYQQTAQMRGQAIVYAQFITEKIRSNNSALGNAAAPTPASAYIAADAYGVATAATLPAEPACGLASQTACTFTQSAEKDMRQWRQSLAALPGGRGSIFQITSGGATDPVTRQVVVMWQEKQQSETGIIGGADPNQAPVDPTCPAPQVAGVRCLNVLVTP